MATELGQLWLPPMALKDARVNISAGVWHWACSHPAPGRVLSFCARFASFSYFTSLEVWPRLLRYVGRWMGSHVPCDLPGEGGHCGTRGWSAACRSASPLLSPAPCPAAHAGWVPHSHTGRSCRYEKRALLNNKKQKCLLCCGATHGNRPGKEEWGWLPQQAGHKQRAQQGCQGGWRWSRWLVGAHLPRSCFWAPAWEEREGCMRKPKLLQRLYNYYSFTECANGWQTESNALLGQTSHTVGQQACPSPPHWLLFAFPLLLHLGTEI